MLDKIVPVGDPLTWRTATRDLQEINQEIQKQNVGQK
jgi:hypothetical protein